MPAGPPIDSTLIGYFVSADEVRTTTVHFDLEFGDGFGQASLVVLGSEGSLQLGGFRVFRTEGSVADLNAFRLRGKSWLHIAMLLAMALSVSTCVLGVICAVRLPGLRWRWAWVLFSAFGLGELCLNWTTGQWTYSPFAWSLLGTATFRPGLVGPWTLWVGFPLGAMIVLIRRRQQRSTDGETELTRRLVAERVTSPGAKSGNGLDP